VGISRFTTLWSSEKTHFLQECRCCLDSFSVCVSQLIALEMVELAECTIQSVSWCVAWIH